MSVVRCPGGALVDGWPFCSDRELPIETTAPEATIRAIVAPGLSWRARRAGDAAPPGSWADAAIACASLRPAQVARLVEPGSRRRRFDKLARCGARIVTWGLVRVARSIASENELARVFGCASPDEAVSRLLGLGGAAA